MFGKANYQNILRFSQMSPKEKEIAMEKGKELERVRIKELELEKQKQKQKNIANIIMAPIIILGIIGIIFVIVFILTNPIILFALLGNP